MNKQWNPSFMPDKAMGRSPYGDMVRAVCAMWRDSETGLLYFDGKVINRPAQLVTVGKTEASGDEIIKSGGDFTDLASAVASITDASATKPYCIVVYPGIHEVSEVTLPDYVSLVGLDNRSCILRSTTEDMSYVIAVGEQSCLSGITISNNCTFNFGAASVVSSLIFEGKPGRVYDCRIENTVTLSGGDTTVHGITVNDTVDIWDTDIYVNVTSTVVHNIGIYVDTAADVNLRGCSIESLGMGSGYGYAVWVNSTGALALRGCDVQAPGNCIYYEDTSTIICESTVIEATANNGTAVRVSSSDNGSFYGCTIRSHGTATDCFAEVSGTPNIKVAHCRMNRASPLHADLTNLVKNPHNVYESGLIVDYDSITATSEGVAASLATKTTLITTNGDQDLDNVTLGDGEAGQVKYFTVIAEGNANDTVKITPANMNGGTQITFSATPVGEGCTMVFGGGAWNIIANNGGTIS